MVTGRLVGVLALQGGVIEHERMVEALGGRSRRVRRPQDLEGVEALILPGGESTTMTRLLKAFDLTEAVAHTARSVPTLGTCAGLIVLSQLGVLDVEVERNAFGPQVDSAEVEVPWREQGTVRAAFIRAPRVTRTGPGVTVLSTWQDPNHPGQAPSIVGVEQVGDHGPVLGISFHPELTGDPSVHRDLLA